MPNFDTSPPTDLGRSGYRLIRTPAAHPLIGHILSDNLIGCRTHFTANRTIPCESPNCELCNTGIAWRWHGYVLIVIDATQEVVIFECTARSSQSIAAYFQRYGTTRGAHMKAARSPARANGRVLIQLRPADLEKVNLPKALAVEKLLCHIWNIPEGHVSTSEGTPRPPFKDTQVDRSAPVRIDNMQQAAAFVKDNGRKRNRHDSPDPANPA